MSNQSFSYIFFFFTFLATKNQDTNQIYLSVTPINTYINSASKKNLDRFGPYYKLKIIGIKLTSRWKKKKKGTNLTAIKMWRPNWLQIKSDRDQINCYQNVRTKLIMIPKYRDQNSIYLAYF